MASNKKNYRLVRVEETNNMDDVIAICSSLGFQGEILDNMHVIAICDSFRIKVEILNSGHVFISIRTIGEMQGVTIDNVDGVILIGSSLGIQGAISYQVFLIESYPSVLGYPSVSFNVAGATEATYRHFITAVREVMTWGTNTIVNGLPVLNPEASLKVGDRFVLIRLINGNTVTLAIDVANLYVVAFSSSNNKSFFFKDFTTLQRNNLFVGTIQTLLSFTGNYINIESQLRGRGRNFLHLGPTPLADAITRLWYGENVAEPLIVVIQMVSEAARFRYIEEQVCKSITDQNTFTPKGLILSMENNWSSMSKAVLHSPDGESFIRSVQLQDDNYQRLIVNDFTTLSRYTMIAILLHQSTSSYDSYNAQQRIVSGNYLKLYIYHFLLLRRRRC